MLRKVRAMPSKCVVGCFPGVSRVLTARGAPSVVGRAHEMGTRAARQRARGLVVGASASHRPCGHIQNRAIPMKMLTSAAAGKARSFVEDEGRPLERAKLAFHLDGAGPDAVVSELAEFQNADGGFGHGLEPDLRTPATSALATTVGMQTLREVGAA